MKNRIFTNITGETRNTKIMKFTKNQKKKIQRIENLCKIGKTKIQKLGTL